MNSPTIESHTLWLNLTDYVKSNSFNHLKINLLGGYFLLIDAPHYIEKLTKLITQIVKKWPELVTDIRIFLISFRLF